MELVPASARFEALIQQIGINRWRGLAPAKVNLHLEVLGKRTDGYHALETLLVPINLYDSLSVDITTDSRLSLTCNQSSIPIDDRNLVWKAADLLQARFSVPHGAKIHLEKRIPHEAGLGGGSSDAATTLQLLSLAWGVNLPTAMLLELAAELGSDVGAFLVGPAWGTGRGEIVQSMPGGAELWLVLAKPPVGCPTGQVYKNLQFEEATVNGEAILQAWQSGDVGLLAKCLHNRLQSAAFALQPPVKRLYDRMKACQPLGGLLSGSGSTVFALCRDQAHATSLANRLRASCGTEPLWMAVARTLTPWPGMVPRSPL